MYTIWPVLKFLLILVAAFIVAGVIKSLVVGFMIATAGLDAKITKLLDKDDQKFSLSKLAGTIVNVIVIIFFVVEGLNVLQLEVLTNIGTVVIGYMPAVLSAVIIAAVAIAVALAFGLGGKEFAANTLKKIDTIDEEKK